MNARMWFQAAVVLAVALGAGCPEEFPQQPQIRVQLSPNPFDFGKRFIGTSNQASLSITNKGLDDLVISTVTLTGDGVFTVYHPSDGSTNPSATTIQANKTGFYAILFAPTQVKSYTGNVNIASNAQNAPSQDIPVLGEGVNP